MGKTYSGFNNKTAENLLLDAGAFFINFNQGTDTYDSAVSSGKLLGATNGGGEFVAKPEMRQVEVDGVKGAAKGLEVIDSWEVTLAANVIEVTAEGLTRAIAGAEVNSDSDYDIITAKNYLVNSDYIDNVTWIGTLSGSDSPVIIQVFNALNTEGLTITTEDKNNATIKMVFKGHYDSDDLDTPPFTIYYPKTN